jgi:hypothetical protein
MTAELLPFYIVIFRILNVAFWSILKKFSTTYNYGDRFKEGKGGGACSNHGRNAYICIPYCRNNRAFAYVTKIFLLILHMNATEKMPRKAINKLNDFMCSPYFPFT